MKKKSIAPVFKEYTQGQIVLLPTDMEAQIPPKHLVRVVNAAIEKMDLARLPAQYKGGGTSSCHPKMLLKVLVYGYTQQLYSSRKIAKALTCLLKRGNSNFSIGLPILYTCETSLVAPKNKSYVDCEGDCFML